MRHRVQAAAAAVLAGVVALHSIVTPDLWWHLASGRWIVEHRAVPVTDPFTYTLADRPWVNLQWLTDVVLFWAWGTVGPDGLVLAKTAVLMITAVLFVLTARAAGAGPGAAGTAAVLAVLAGAERTMVRPEILSGLALAWILWVLYRGSRSRVLLWTVPFVVALWANVHSLAFLGPLTVLWHTAVTILDARLPETFRDPRRSPACSRTLAVVGLVSGLALLLNPYGSQAWTFPLVLFERINGASAIFGRILEFARPLTDPSDPALRFFWVLSGATIVTSFANLPRVAVARLLVMLPFLVLALLARRNIPMFALAATPVLAANLSDLAVRFRGPPLRWVPPLFALLMSVFLLRGASGPWLGTWRDRGLFVTPGLFPEDCIAHLDESGHRGRLFHDLDFGGYIAWRNPERRTFIDGRLEVAGPEWFRAYVDAHEKPSAWRRVMTQWGPRVLVLQHASSGSGALLHVLLQTREWKAICYSPEAAVLVLREDAGPVRDKLRPTAAAWETILAEDRGPAPGAGTALRFLTDPFHAALTRRPSFAAVRRANHYASLCLTLGWIPQARQGLKAIVRAAPKDPEALLNLGWCDVRDGDPTAARLRWTDALSTVDRASRPRFEAAIADLDRGVRPGDGPRR